MCNPAGGVFTKGNKSLLLRPLKKRGNSCSFNSLFTENVKRTSSLLSCPILCFSRSPPDIPFFLTVLTFDTSATHHCVCSQFPSLIWQALVLKYTFTVCEGGALSSSFKMDTRLLAGEGFIEFIKLIAALRGGFPRAACLRWYTQATF